MFLSSGVLGKTLQRIQETLRKRKFFELSHCHMLHVPSRPITMNPIKPDSKYNYLPTIHEVIPLNNVTIIKSVTSLHTIKEHDKE